MSHHDEEISGEPLTAAENKKLRRMIREEERMSWLWATMRIWVGWGAGACAAIYAAHEWVFWAIKKLMAK